MTLSVHYAVNSPKVIYDLFDDEVVIINLENGCYYSTDKLGFAIWKHLIAGASTEEIAERFSRRYTSPSEQMSRTIEQFVKHLQDEFLLVPASGNGTSVPSKEDDAPLPAAFEDPVLHKYADMKELLLLDPIHDVDEKGWPIAKK